MHKNKSVLLNYNTVMPYLVLQNAAGFIIFMQAVFSASETTKIYRDDDTIMHAQIMVDDSVIMLADSTKQFPAQPAGMFIYVDDADETYYKAIEKGATSIMEPADQSYGRSCGVKDPFGNTWWITSMP